MIDITKEEMDYLIAHGRTADIHLSSRTHKSKSKTRFVAETFETKRLLNEYRKNKIVSTYDGR